MTENMHSEYIITISCPDVPGISAAVATFIHEHGGFILESNQYGDPQTNTFFQRIHFRRDRQDDAASYAELKQLFDTKITSHFHMHVELHNAARKPKVLMMVSKYSHCLNNLLYHYQNGSLKVDIPAVVSNHPDLQRLVAWYDIPFYHFPIKNVEGSKERQEAQIIELIEEHAIDLVVLARYMQILSPELSGQLAGKAINIHHSFLPSFKGAKPYHQAHNRGVKLIGATAHYVTQDLDEGPIIEQEVKRVDHKYTAEELVDVGQEIESDVLYRAVRYHAEHRVLLNQHKTVVFL
jgi:formyltetrahydrofolate deformylase